MHDGRPPTDGSRADLSAGTAPPDRTITTGLPATPNPSDPFTAGLTDDVIRCSRAHRALAGALLAPLGLHAGQELLLRQLWQENGRTQTSLAAGLRVEPPTVSRMLRRMETAGLVERQRCTTDGRVVRVHLTARGRALREPVLQATRTLEAASTAGLDREEQALLQSLLRRVAASCEQAAGQLPEAPASC